mgnify:CR=1 FL=1
MEIDWGFIVLVAIATVGLVQWLKGILPKAPTWIWAIAAVVLCFGLAALGTLVSRWILLAAVALAAAQLCYELILQGIPKIVGGVLNSTPGGSVETVTKTTTTSTAAEPPADPGKGP